MVRTRSRGSPNVPVLASVSASGLVVQLAREFGMTLVGFLPRRRFVIYSGPSRISDIKCDRC
ncbi:MAG: hypothetical protein DMG97_15580 [Acidobacteria bacterium]|nr:MAG: hypothetical protein DMG97_15580 [Acidobacteriota bacterium]